MLVNNIFNWWVGVVEDRDDPEKLGRVRVRIIGIHSDDKEILPTTDLPWAIPMQPTTSAAMSGLGSSPLGLLPGTWCIGFFIDGDDMQQPVVMGTIGGISQANKLCQIQKTQETLNPQNVLRASDGSPVLDSQGNAVVVASETTTDPTSAISSTLPPLTQEQIQKLMNALGFKESSSVAGGVQNYTATNRANYIGKYQFGAPALITLGYVKSGSLSNEVLNDPSKWTGKDGLSSKEAYFNSPQVQEKIMFENLKFNYNILLKNGTITTNDPPGKVAGLLATSHLLGAGGATNFARGNDSKDGNGTTGKTYYDLGANAVGSEVPLVATASEDAKIPPYVNPAGALNDVSTTKAPAFADPNNEFPKCEYNNLPDTNKLAVGDITETPIAKRIKNIRENIPTVNGSWDEPKPAYCATYPYNFTYQTEAGHLVEFDNTKGQERIHIYHKKGTYMEIDMNGSMVRKVMGDNYEIMEHNDNLFVRGAYKLTVEGATQILVKNDVNLQVYGDATATVNKSLNVNVASDINMNSGGTFNIKARAFNLTTEENVDLSVGSAYKQTAADNTNIIGRNVYIDVNSSRGQIRVDDKLADSASSNSLSDAPEAKTIEEIDIKPLNRPDCTPNAYRLDAGEPGSEQIHQQQVQSGEVVPTTPTESGTAEPAASVASNVNCDCTEFNSFNEFPDSLKLSKYFNLGELSSRAVVVKQKVVENRGLTPAQITCNLKNLAVNCLDKIKETYPDMFVTNAFRLDKQYTTSDHGTGMAADIQFTKATATDYYTIVQWIAENVPYKQILLEYGGGARNPWIHIAFDKSGQKHPLPYATFKDHQVYARNKFINLA
jgi:hypothetical protein